jgi:hypothetical protein
MAQITLNSTGVASSGALALQSNGTTTAVTIDASQNVGIGTISPAFRLDVAGGVGRIIPSGGSANTQESGTGTLNVYGATSSITTRTGALRLESYSDMAVNVGTGIAFSARLNTAPSDSSYTFAKIGGYKENATSGNGAGYLAFATSTGPGDLTERARITADGNLLVARTSAAFLGGAVKFGVEQISSGAWGIGINANNNAMVFNHTSNTSSAVGSITVTTSATAFNTSSDYRLKNTIAPMTGALAKVALLKPVTYKWNFDGSSGEGFIAHELQAVVPDAVTGEKDAVETYTDEDGVEQTRPVYQGIDTSFLVATLTAAIQELKAIVDAQAVEIAALKGTA